MPLISVPQHVTPFQVEMPEGISRSRKGSIHVKPGTLHLTEDEWAHAELHVPELVGVATVALAEDHAPAIEE